MPRFRPSPTLALAVLLAAPAGVQADELLMNNGDRISGQVVSRSGDTLKFKTSYAGILAVSWSEIDKVSTDEPMTVQVDHEQVIATTAISNRDEELVVRDEVTEQEMVMQQRALTAINPEPWTLGKGYKFSGIVNFSAKTERGNNDSDEIDADGEAEYRRQRHRGRALFTFEKDNKDGDSTKNKWKARTSYDYFPRRHWNLGFQVPKWYYGATALGEKDQFADLTLRAGLGPHVGYQFYEGHDMNLLTEVGILRVHEEYKNDPDNNYWAGGWLIDFDKFLLSDLTQFYHRQTGIQGVSGSHKLVWNSWTGFRVPLWAGFVGSLELQIEYDSEPAAEAETTDYTTRVKIGYQW